MGAMIKEILIHYPAAIAACVVLLAVVVLFSMIGVWVFKAKLKPEFDRASRLPLGEEN